MDGDQHPDRVALRRTRQRVIERLSEAFADDALGLDEFDRRIEAAHRLESEEAFDALVADLDVSTKALAVVAPAATAPTGRRSTVIKPSRAAPTSLGAVFGNLVRRGSWRPDKWMRASAVFGNVELDFREAQLPPGVTYLEVRAVCGTITIRVPPGVAIECEGRPILGSFESASDVPPGRSFSGSVLRVTGSAILGAVDIQIRDEAPRRALPGSR